VDGHQAHVGSPRRLRAVPALAALPGAAPPSAGSPLLPAGSAQRAVLSAVGADDASPRVPALDALLRDVDGLRLALRADLALAATALHADEPELAAWLVGAESDRVHSFAAQSLHRLRELETAPSAEAVPPFLPTQRRGEDPPAAPRRRAPLRRVLAAAPFVAVASAVLLLVLGGLPTHPTAPPLQAAPAGSTSTLASYAVLARLTAANAPADQVRAAAVQLHASLAPLLAGAGTDPQALRQALDLLRAEQRALSSTGEHGQLGAVLLASRQLAHLLSASLQRVERAVSARVPAPLSSTAAPRPAVRRHAATAAPATPVSTRPSRRPARPAAHPRPTTGPAAPSRPSAGPTQAPAAPAGPATPPAPILPTPPAGLGG